MHTARRGGRARQQILYWFRTPPGVKVGRPALDEAAIRWIEEQNPDIEFDWPKILQAQPPPQAPPEDPRSRRGRRDKQERRRQARPEPAPRATESGPQMKAESADAERHEAEGAQEEALHSEVDAEDAVPDEGLPEEAVAEAFEQLTHPEIEERAEPVTMPAEQIGAEQLTRLRARFAELQARIVERGGDAARIEALRAQADPLNPDTWVTEEEVRKGIENFEPGIRELRAALGLRRRRRSRRGGRRRGGGSGEGAPPAESSSEPSE